MKRIQVLLSATLSTIVLLSSCSYYEEGYEEGYQLGFEEGHEAGHTEGHTEGYEEGHTEGYEEGHTEGYEESIRENEDKIRDDYIAETKLLSNRIENGMILRRTSFPYNDDEIYQNILVERKKHFYWLNVRGGEECDLGIIEFNPDEKGWQQVIVDSDPNDGKMKGYDMKIGGSGQDRIKVEGAMNVDWGNMLLILKK